MRNALICLACLIPLSGCVSTVAKVVTAPVRVAGKAVDMATTSQSEADEKRGREMRKREEEIGKLERSYRRDSEKCRQGNVDACDRAEREYEELDRMIDVRSREY
ncbi:MAG: hypothetical protein KDE32_13535 [Novosphingobium sp.]|nr:hypothetical protein [Novosphingobium sp.]